MPEGGSQKLHIILVANDWMVFWYSTIYQHLFFQLTLQDITSVNKKSIIFKCILIISNSKKQTKKQRKEKKERR